MENWKREREVKIQSRMGRRIEKAKPLTSKRTKTILVLLRERNFMGFIYAMKFLSNWERNLGFKFLSNWEREKFHGVYAKTVLVLLE